MKTKVLNTIENNKRRASFALCVIVFVLVPTLAQVKSPKRLTGLQLGEAMEGSKVTIISDSALTDYEAYRRGDRFYVKIPLAEVAGALPHLRANGFEDTQVQKSGDGVVISFRLQPGASARVDLRGNRLDVIFSAPNRAAFMASRAAQLQSYPGSQNSTTRNSDSAGPLPPGSVSSSRDTVVSESSSNPSDGSVADPWAINPAGNTGRRSSKSRNATSDQAIASASPLPSATPTLGAGTYPPYVASPSPASTISSGKASSTTLKQRFASARNWVSSNRAASVVGTLILLGLILFAVFAYRNRRNQARRAKLPKVQPKYSDGDLPGLADSSSDELEPSRLKSEPVAQTSNVMSEGARVSSPMKPEPKPAKMPAAAAAHPASGWTPTPAAVVSTGGQSNEEEEREVFEL